jgi:phosphomannomutase
MEINMKKLDFGTAGIRGILGSGEGHLNDAHIIRVTEGFAKYLLVNVKDVKNQGIVIGRDNRRMSKRFSEIAASILTKYEIKVHYNQEIAATPFISFTTRSLGAAGAINITASHNPKEYNGVKLYDKEGCQLLPSEISELLTHFKPYNDYENVQVTFEKNKYLHFISNELMNSYLDEVKKIGGEVKNFSNIKIAYTPQHGTGAVPVKALFDDLNIQAFYEENEMKEDTEFTYSATPNPESKESFDNVLVVAKNNDCDIALVTDPDADRVGLAVKHQESYKILSGNETAILIFNYLLEELKGKDLNKYYLVYSFVSSSLPRKMAESNGLKSYMTETGFK